MFIFVLLSILGSPSTMLARRMRFREEVPKLSKVSDFQRGLLFSVESIARLILRIWRSWVSRKQNVVCCIYIYGVGYIIFARV
jgi:hypothetical protein